MAFIGDIDLTGFGPYYGDATSSLAAFRRSLEAVKAIPARAWVTSHHRGVVSDRAIFLDLLAAFTARIDERAERLLQMLGDGPSTLDALVQRRLTYPVGYDELWVNDAERRTIAQHLNELCANGRARLLDDGASRGPDRSTQTLKEAFRPKYGSEWPVPSVRRLPIAIDSGVFRPRPRTCAAPALRRTACSSGGR